MFIVNRFLWLLLSLFLIVTIAFFVIRFAPGGPFDKERVLPESVRKNIEAKYHFDEPLYRQYLRYLKGLSQGDLGPSFKYPNRTVNEIIADGFPVSLRLGLAALILATAAGSIAGTVGAVKQNRWPDYLSLFIVLTGICLPNFVLGPLLILLFSLKLGWFHVAGFRSSKDLILPAITLGAVYAAYIARLVRAGMLDVLQEDFVRTARSKGLSEKVVIMKHALRIAFLPVLSFLGPACAGIVTGSMVVETIFNIPGIGRHFILGALNRDYTLVIGTVILYSSLLMLLNLLVDLAYRIIDPRIKYNSR